MESAAKSAKAALDAMNNAASGGGGSNYGSGGTPSGESGSGGGLSAFVENIHASVLAVLFAFACRFHISFSMPMMLPMKADVPCDNASP